MPQLLSAGGVCVNLKLSCSKMANWGVVRVLLDDVSNTLRRESSLSKVIVLSKAEGEYFTPSTPLFGVHVAFQFPSLAYEIEEIGKCLALGRSTAAVFHSARCLEAAIRALTRCIGIPDPVKGPDRSWGNILRSVKDKIDASWPPNTAGRLSSDAKLFERCHAALVAMMNPYRNDTMHLDAKYTEAEAVHIYEVIKGFMMIVASRCDENGEPKV